MGLACAAAGSGASLMQDLAGYADCSAQALGRSGFGGGMADGLLAACLTIYVAVIGYRLLLGEVFDVRAIVLAAVRVGVVVTFCLSWSSFETVFYRLAIEGPAEIASGALGSAGGGSSASAIAARAQTDYETAQFGHQTPPAPAQPTAASPPAAAASAGTTPAPPPAREGNSTITQPGLIFFVSAAGGLIAVRLVTGLLLAIGPLVIAFGLFDNALGLVEGWLRALTGAALATAGLLVVTLLELDFVEAQIALPAPDNLSAQGLTLIGLVFCVVSLVMVIFTGLAARAIRFRLRPAISQARATWAPGDRSRATFSRLESSTRPAETVSRAQSIADAVEAQARRERLDLGAVPGSSSRRSRPRAGDREGGVGDIARPTPLGQSLRRAPSARRSVSVTRREGRR